MKREYALEWLDYLITTVLAPIDEGVPVLSEEDLAIYKVKAVEKKERIRLLLMRQLFSLRDEKMVEVLVQQYQSSMVMLLDKIQAYQELKPYMEGRWGELVTALFTILKDLLHYIETFFSKYFNTDQHVPRFYLMLHQKEWKESLKKLVEWASTKGEPLLVDSLRRTFQFFIGASSLSYKKLLYAKELFSKAGEGFEATNGGEAFFTPMEACLFYLNYNEAFFVAHLVRKIEKALEEEESNRLGKLQFYGGMVESMPCKPGFILNEALPSLSSSLSRWIEFQINGLRQVTDPAPSKEALDDKIHLSVSVATFALFIRLLTEEEIITTRNQAALIRFFATHFATAKQGTISAESLYGSYFKPQPGTVRIMTECLYKLQQQLQKNF